MDTNHNHCLLLGLLALGLSQNATAQGALVLPNSHQGIEGTGSTNVPFGRSLPVRSQMIYDSVLVPQARTIQELRFRPDLAFQSSGKRLTLGLRACTMPGSVTQASTTFAANLGSDTTDVLGGARPLDLPAGSRFPKAEAFPIPVPFVRAFSYDPQRGALLFDFQVQQQAKGAYRLDSTYVCESPLESYGPLGCGRGAGDAPRIQALTRNIVWGNQLRLRIEGAPAHAVTMLFFGNQTSGSWRGLALPWNAAPIGAPLCHLSTNVLYAPRRGSDAQGRAEFGWNVPLLLRLQKAWVTVQAVAEDRMANPLGIVTSQAVRLRFCGLEPVGRVFAGGSQPTVGVREFGVAPVVRLQ